MKKFDPNNFAVRENMRGGIEEYCHECCDPIMVNEGRYRVPSGVYHSECYEREIKSRKVLLKAAESMSFDRRIVA